MKDKLKGGIADNIPDTKFNKIELKKGQEHEKEHTTDKSIAKEIAKDHITEDPQYYEKIDQIEGSSESKKKDALDRANKVGYNQQGQQHAGTVEHKPIKIKLIKKIDESSFMASGAVSFAPTFNEKED